MRHASHPCKGSLLPVLLLSGRLLLHQAIRGQCLLLGEATAHPGTAHPGILLMHGRPPFRVSLISGTLLIIWGDTRAPLPRSTHTRVHLQVSHTITHDPRPLRAVVMGDIGHLPQIQMMEAMAIHNVLLRVSRLFPPIHVGLLLLKVTVVAIHDDPHQASHTFRPIHVPLLLILTSRLTQGGHLLLTVTVVTGDRHFHQTILTDAM